MSFGGAVVLSFESRRAQEMAQLIRLNGGEPLVAPSVIEVPLEHNEQAFDFAERLFGGEFDMMLLLTGVGIQLLSRVLVTRYPLERLIESLQTLTLVVRGPKPMAVLREWGLPAIQVPEPNTWREILGVLEGRPERRVAVQEYGRRSPELLDGLRVLGMEITTVPVYQWQMTANTEPLENGFQKLLQGEVSAVLFTASVQLDLLMEWAAKTGNAEAFRTALKKVFVGSIGPTCTETLQRYGIERAMEPSHPKMGILVREAALQFAKQAS